MPSVPAEKMFRRNEDHKRSTEECFEPSLSRNSAIGSRNSSDISAQRHLDATFLSMETSRSGPDVFADDHIAEQAMQRVDGAGSESNMSWER